MAAKYMTPEIYQLAREYMQDVSPRETGHEIVSRFPELTPLEEAQQRINNLQSWGFSQFEVDDVENIAARIAAARFRARINGK
jgi:hypothetical protein